MAARPEAAGAVVVGCDSLLEVDGEAHGKPASIEHARRRLTGCGAGRQTCGRATAWSTRPPAGRCPTWPATEVRLRRLHRRGVDAYVATGEPLAVAGGFTLDGRSAPFVAGIDGDHGTVIGLSLPLFRQLLARAPRG